MSTLAMLMAAVGAPKVYATLDPAKTGIYIILSNGNLKAVGTNYAGSRATVGKSTGKWYWEVTGDAASFGASNQVQIGMVGAAVTDFTSGPGFFPGAATTPAVGLNYNYNNSLDFFKDGVEVQAFALTNLGNVTVGFAFDADAHTLAVYVANTLKYTYTGLTATTWYPAVGFGPNAGGCSVTCGFGASALAYSPPPGYNAGVYN